MEAEIRVCSCIINMIRSVIKDISRMRLLSVCLFANDGTLLASFRSGMKQSARVPAVILG